MDNRKISRSKRFRLFLRRKYRLVILNDSTFGEQFSIRLSPYGLIIGALAITIVMTSAVISLVAFTPLREYIPGYGDVSERKQIVTLNLVADSLEQVLETRDLYLQGILNAMNERVETKTPKPRKDTTGKYASLKTSPSKADNEFRKEFEENRGNAGASLARIKYSNLDALVFFPPVKGLLISSFDATVDHFGVDIITPRDETIKSTLDGTIIFTGFSAFEGNIIHVQHSNNLVSIYKHCSAFLKQTGQHVQSGEAIGVVGNSGEKTSGPHLHFELWFNGSPINPQEFVVF